jgi:hypothetical protein
MYDFHLHTNRSDGKYAAADLLRIVAAKGVSVAAITDHDTFLGYRDALPFAEELHMKLVPGVELSTRCDVDGKFAEEIHILWYGMDVTSAKVVDFELEVKQGQNRRVDEVLKLMKDDGYNLDLNKILHNAGPAPACISHIVFQMIERGYLPLDFGEIEQFVVGKFSPGCAYFIPPPLGASEAVDAIARLGGWSVMAHPGKIIDDRIFEALLPNVHGIEICHPSHSKDEITRFRTIAYERNQLCSAGSDFHGYYESCYTPPILDSETYKEVSEFAERMLCRRV